MTALCVETGRSQTSGLDFLCCEAGRRETAIGYRRRRFLFYLRFDWTMKRLAKRRVVRRRLIIARAVRFR